MHTQRLGRRSFLGRCVAGLAAALGCRSCGEMSPCPAGTFGSFMKFEPPRVLRAGTVMRQTPDGWVPNTGTGLARGVLARDCLPHEVSDKVIDQYLIPFRFA